MPQFEVMIGNSGVETFTADSKAGAYKQAVKKHCDKGEVPFMKMTEGVITKEVLPLFKKSIEDDDEELNQTASTLAMYFLNSGDPDVVDVDDDEKMDLADGFDDGSIATFDEAAERLFKKNKAKGVAKFKKNLLTLCRSAVFYLRFLNEPQVLYCNKEDVFQSVHDLFGFQSTNWDSSSSLKKLKEANGKLIPFLTYDRKKIAADPEYKEKFLNIMLPTAYHSNFSKSAEAKEYYDKFSYRSTKKKEDEDEEEEPKPAPKPAQKARRQGKALDEAEKEYLKEFNAKPVLFMGTEKHKGGKIQAVSWEFKGKDYELNEETGAVYREDEDGEYELVGFKRIVENDPNRLGYGNKGNKKETIIVKLSQAREEQERGLVHPFLTQEALDLRRELTDEEKPEEAGSKEEEEEDPFTSEKVSELLKTIADLTENYEVEKQMRGDREDELTKVEAREDKYIQKIKELREENFRLSRETREATTKLAEVERKTKREIELLEFGKESRQEEIRVLELKLKRHIKQLSVAKERGYAEAQRNYSQFKLVDLEKEMKQFIKDRIDDEVEEGVDRVISQSELDLRDRFIEELRDMIFDLTNFTVIGEALAVSKDSVVDSDQFRVYNIYNNMVKLLGALFDGKIARQFERLAKETSDFLANGLVPKDQRDIEDIIRGYDKTDFSNYNFEELKNEMRVSLGEFTPEELYTRDTNRRLQMELEELELVLLFGTTSYGEIKDIPEVKFSNKASFGGKQKLDPDYGKPYVETIARKYKKIDRKIVEIQERAGTERDLRILTENEYRGLVAGKAGEAREVEREERVVVEEAKASEEVAKLKAENDMLERQLSEARDDTDDFARNALELEEKVKELEEAVAEGQEDDRGNAYDILEVILETLGVEVESVLAEAMAMGLDKFIGSEKI